MEREYPGCYEDFHHSLSERFRKGQAEPELLQIALPMYELQPEGKTLQKLVDTCPLTDEIFYRGGISEIRQSFSYLISVLDRSGLLEKRAALEKSELWFAAHPNPVEMAACIKGNPWRDMEDWNQPEAEVLRYTREFFFDSSKEKQSGQWEPITLRMADEQNIPLSELLPNERYKFTIHCRALQDYDICRGEWYQEELLDADLPFVESAYFRADTFFGHRGSLVRIPKRLILAYNLSMELEVSSEFLNYIFPSNSMDEEVELVRKITIMGIEFPVDYNRLGVANGMDDNLKIALPSTEELAVLGVISRQVS